MRKDSMLEVHLRLRPLKGLKLNQILHKDKTDALQFNSTV